MALQSETTSFTLDNMGRFLCNTLQEAMDSAAISVAGRQRGFDVVVIGGGTFGAVIASRLLLNDETHSRRILVLESGPFALPEHVQNMPYQGGTPDFRVPWDSHPALGYAGLLFAIGGRSIAWGGWSPQLLDQEFKNWPPSVVAALKNSYFQQASDQIGATDSNDFIYGRLHTALRRQLFDGMAMPAAAPHAIKLSALPDHPAVRYQGQEAVGDLTFAAGASGGSTTTTSGGVTDDRLRELLGLKPTDTTSRTDMLNLLKLEAPLAVQSRTEPGLFPFNKFSAVPELIKVARVTSGEAGGIGPDADARKRLMIVPKVRVLDIITETQSDNWVRVTGVRVKDTDGLEKAIPVAPPNNGSQSTVVVALGTIESTKLAINTFKDSLAGRGAQRMGKNLIAHLRSNLTIRVPVTSLSSLPASTQSSLQASALFVKGKANVAGEDRLFHLQITACGLNKLGADSEAELFKKIPDTEQIDSMLRATDTHVVITLRGIGEMTPQNADSFVRLSPKTEDSRAIAEVSLADVKTGTSNTSQSNVDKQTWDAMDALADEIALIFANGKPFEILGAKEGKTIPMPAGATAADLRTKHPFADRRDAEGSTHHDAGTLWMGDDPATSVTNEFGRIHDTTNCYVDAPALFPSLGSPNPMLTGVALSRRTADLLQASVLPRAAVRNAAAAGFTALFDGTVGTFKRWRLAGGANSGQGFAFLNGELASFGAADFSMLYYAPQAFADFHLRLQFRVFDPNNCNSGVFIRFRDPLHVLPDALRQRADAEGAPVAANPAWSAVFSGFEVQIDDNARGDVNKDYYGRRPEPDGLFKNRTGAIYKIPAGDLIIHTGGHDARIQQYTPGPPTRPGVWMQYDIVVTGNHYEVKLTDTETGASQVTTIFDNTDARRGLAKIDGAPAGFIGIQSYPSSPVAFRDIWIK